MYLEVLDVKHDTVNEKVLQFRYFSHNSLSWDHFWTKLLQLSDIMAAVVHYFIAVA